MMVIIRSAAASSASSSSSSRSNHIISHFTTDIKVKGKAEHLYSALHGTNILKRSGMDHTAFNLKRTPCLPLPRKRSPDDASTECGGEHLIAAHYSFIDPEKMKG